MKNTIKKQLVAFVEACAAYPADEGGDQLFELEGCPIVDSANALGLSEVADFSASKITALCAAMENCDADIKVITKAVNAIYHEDYAFLPNIFYDDQLGEEIILRNVENYDFAYWLINYVLTEELGKDYRESNKGCYTRWGYFQYGEF